MSLSRREFLKLAIAANAALAMGVRVSAASSFIDFSSFDLSKLAQLVVPDSTTLQYSVRSPCCWLCYSHYVVSHYQPVVFVEVINGPGDTVFGGSGSAFTGSV